MKEIISRRSFMNYTKKEILQHADEDIALEFDFAISQIGRASCRETV